MKNILATAFAILFTTGIFQVQKCLAVQGKVAESNQARPEFELVESFTDLQLEGAFVNVVAKFKQDQPRPKFAYMHYSTDPKSEYKRIAMRFDGLRHVAEVPALTPSQTLYYFLEAQIDGKPATTRFYPELGKEDPATVSLHLKKAESSPIAINEVHAVANLDPEDEIAKAKPVEETKDWIELKNISNGEVSFTGYYLTDDISDPLKWQFPAGTKLEAGQLMVVWADKPADGDGLHCNFKLSRKGEEIWLTQRSSNSILDKVKFGKQTSGRSFARILDGKWSAQNPSPGKPNSGK